MPFYVVCNHPFLFDSSITNEFFRFTQLENTASDVLDEQQQFYTLEQLVGSCGKMLVLVHLLDVLKQGGHKVLIFSQVCSM